MSRKNGMQCSAPRDRKTINAAILEGIGAYLGAEEGAWKEGFDARFPHYLLVA